MKQKQDKNNKKQSETIFNVSVCSAESRESDKRNITTEQKECIKI